MSKLAREIIGRGTQVVVGVALLITAARLGARAIHYWGLIPPTPSASRQPLSSEALRTLLLGACSLVVVAVGAVLLIGAIVPASFWDRFVRPPVSGENVEPRRGAGWWLWWSLFHR